MVVVTRRRWPACPAAGRRPPSTSFDGRRPTGVDSMSVPSDLITTSQQQQHVQVLCLASPPHPALSPCACVSARVAPSPSLPPSVRPSLSLSVGRSARVYDVERLSFRASSPPAGATSVLTVVQLGIAAGGRPVVVVGESLTAGRPAHAPHGGGGGAIGRGRSVSSTRPRCRAVRA